jgi:hypothetical protein
MDRLLGGGTDEGLEETSGARCPTSPFTSALEICSQLTSIGSYA